MQRRPRALVGHPKPGDHRPRGQPLLIGGVDLPDGVRVFGSTPGFGSSPPTRGRGQIMPSQPALDGPTRGDGGARSHLVQLNPDADGSPTGVEATESQDVLQQGRRRLGASPTGAVAGGHLGREAFFRRDLGRASRQVANRACRQVEPSGDFGRIGSAADHLGDGQPQREFRGAWH